MRRAFEAGGIGLRPEEPDRAVGMAVGLETLEDFLRIVVDRAGRVHRHWCVVDDPVVVPAGLPVPVRHRHVVGEVATEARILPDAGDGVIAHVPRLVGEIESQRHGAKINAITRSGCTPFTRRRLAIADSTSDVASCRSPSRRPILGRVTSSRGSV